MVCLAFFKSCVSAVELQQALNNIFFLFLFEFYATNKFRDSNKKKSFFTSMLQTQ
jgi:hypothetical protein